MTMLPKTGDPVTRTRSVPGGYTGKVPQPNTSFHWISKESPDRALRLDNATQLDSERHCKLRKPSSQPTHVAGTENRCMSLVRYASE